MKYALEGITELKKNCDTVIVIPNERLLDISDENTSLIEAFEMANEVLYNATRGISDLILMPGLINLDFADVRTTMIDGGAAIMGSATATGPDRAEIAAREAINSPLLDGVSIRGARNVLVNISAGGGLGMHEATTANTIIQQEAGDDAEIIWGTVLDESFGDELRVTVIATGFDLSDDRTQAKIAPNAEKESDPEPSTSKLPKASHVGRAYNSKDGQYYKGEGNLKDLDSPAIHRRELKYIRSNKENSEDERSRDAQQGRREGSGNTLLNDREEKIDKRDTDQPAFLRKIMD